MTSLKEQLSELLPGVEISEDFVDKLTASIETVVAQRVDEETRAIHEKADEYAAEVRKEVEDVKEKAAAYADYVVEEMTQKVEDYCEFVIEQFVKEEKQKLVETEEYCRMAKVFNSIRNVFEQNYFQLDAEPANKALETQLAEAKQDFNNLFEDHRQLKRQIQDYSNYVESENRKAIFESITAELADTQKERLSRLVERAEFPSLDSYKIGLEMMVEELGYKTEKTEDVSEKPAADKNLTEERVVEKPSDYVNRMKLYLDRL